MDDSIIERLRSEEADLVRKLDAVRAVLAAYGLPQIKESHRASASSSSRPRQGAMRSQRGRRELNRFSPYGRSVVEAAMRAIREEQTADPVPTRDLVTLIERNGLVIRGEDKTNALSALLARSIDVESNGRRGWTLAQEESAASSKENEPPDGQPAGGSEADGEDGPTSPSSPFNP